VVQSDAIFGESRDSRGSYNRGGHLARFRAGGDVFIVSNTRALYCVLVLGRNTRLVLVPGPKEVKP